MVRPKNTHGMKNKEDMTMKKDIRTLAALLIASATFVACSSDDNIANENQQPVNPTGKYTLTINASKSDRANTRALTLDETTNPNTLTASWATSENVYVQKSGTWASGSLKPQANGAEATLKGELSGISIAADDVLTLQFPRSGARDYTGQVGTLDDIAAKYDYATATVEVEGVSGTGNIIPKSETTAFASQQAIVKFTLLDKADGTTPLCATKLVVNDGTTDYTIIPDPAFAAPDELFVAIPGFSDKTVTLNATVDGNTYTYERSAVTFTNGKYYEITVKMSKVVDLSKLTGNYTAQNGDVLTGTLDGSTKPYKVSIAVGATVTLNNATINGVNSSDYAWAGLTCEGNATIIVKDGTTNSVTGFCEGYPGIYVPVGKTVTIKGETEGTGVLNAQGCVSATYGNRTAGAGIGAGASLPCGNIVIEGGVINATGGYACAAIGGAFLAACGDITITGGTVTASGSASAAGIGGGWYSTSGNIEITGGTVNARSNEVLNTRDGGPGIGCGALCVGGNITIGGTAHVTAQGGEVCAAGIGSGGTFNNVGSTCGNITIGGTANVTAQGGSGGAGIGTGGAVVGNSICGDILINGGTVTATADSYSAGIGSGVNYSTCQCGTITITSDVTKVTATKGTDLSSLCSIGVGFYYNDGATIMSSTSGAVTIGGTEYWDGSAYQNGGDTYLTQSPLVYQP